MTWCRDASGILEVLSLRAMITEMRRNRAGDLLRVTKSHQANVSFSCSPIGNLRMRTPDALKIALHNAGARVGMPISPMPVGVFPHGNTWHSISFGTAAM